MFKPMLRCNAAMAARTARPVGRSFARALALGLSITAPVGYVLAAIFRVLVWATTPRPVVEVALEAD